MSYTATYFSERELACKHCGQSGCTDELKEALDELRRLAGKPVIIHDAYRCNQHNSTVSLVKNSQHPAGTAADWHIEGMSLQAMYDLAKQVPAFANGGIGVYAGNYVHTDVRGTKARWSFIGSKEESITALVKE